MVSFLCRVFIPCMFLRHVHVCGCANVSTPPAELEAPPSTTECAHAAALGSEPNNTGVASYLLGRAGDEHVDDVSGCGATNSVPTRDAGAILPSDAEGCGSPDNEKGNDTDGPEATANAANLYDGDGGTSADAIDAAGDSADAGDRCIDLDGANVRRTPTRRPLWTMTMTWTSVTSLSQRRFANCDATNPKTCGWMG